ncbi:MAG TPA: rhodanese-like domain-containing protein [Chitinophagaceae bacterium]|nr:rhodanese-like domain-containing protein [Chitinophagaceae bacterium]
MIEMIRKIFGVGRKADLKELVNSGAQIIDVRTREEYQRGHLTGSVNIPLQSLSHHLSKIRKDKPVITCCASGMRSASAKTYLQSHGFSQVYNGGGWLSLKHKNSQFIRIIEKREGKQNS